MLLSTHQRRHNKKKIENTNLYLYHTGWVWVKFFQQMSLSRFQHLPQKWMCPQPEVMVLNKEWCNKQIKVNNLYEILVRCKKTKNEVHVVCCCQFSGSEKALVNGHINTTLRKLLWLFNGPCNSIQTTLSSIVYYFSYLSLFFSQLKLHVPLTESFMNFFIKVFQHKNTTAWALWSCPMFLSDSANKYEERIFLQHSSHTPFIFIITLPLLLQCYATLGKQEISTKYWFENLKGRDYLENFDIDHKIILKCILQKYGLKMWTWWTGPAQNEIMGFCDHSYEFLGYIETTLLFSRMW
jgi:hypothetical protein